MTFDPLDSTQLQANGPLVISYPFHDTGDPAHVVGEQEYFIVAENYEPAAVNEEKTIAGVTCYFVGDTPPTKGEAGVVNFTRKWASIPATIYNPTTIAGTLPGILDVRSPVSFVLIGRVKEEYFLVGTGETYETFDEIPVVLHSTAGTVDGAFPLFGGGFVLDGDTNPTATAYQAAIADDVADATSYSYKAADSSLTRYMGNIWKRMVTEVKAR